MNLKIAKSLMARIISCSLVAMITLHKTEVNSTGCRLNSFFLYIIVCKRLKLKNEIKVC